MSETFGARFARLRKQKGFTQEQIAEKVNISYQSVSKWENDITSPDISLLVPLSDILGVTVDQLMGKQSQVTVKMQDSDINNMILRIVVESAQNDKVKLNLPVALVKMCLDKGMAIPMGGGKLEDVDFVEVMKLIECGVVGKLVDIESAKHDKIYVVAEYEDNN